LSALHALQEIQVKGMTEKPSLEGWFLDIFAKLQKQFITSWPFNQGWTSHVFGFFTALILTR